MKTTYFLSRNTIKNQVKPVLRVLIFLIGLCLTFHSLGQNSTCPVDYPVYQPSAPINNGQLNVPLLTPNGLMDYLYDSFGNKYLLADLAIDASIANGFNSRSPSSVTCTAGFFILYFDANSGMGGSTPTEINRRATVCQAFSDLSYLVSPSFAASTSTVKVHILVDAITNYMTPSAAAGSNVLGAASSYYAFPTFPSSPNPGIVDNMTYQTIISQTDAYNGLLPPMNVPSGAAFYHGFTYFNFANTNFSWNDNTSIACPAGLIDLYNVALHEATHILGVSSLIKQNGGSVFGTANNYYGRYDMFLTNSLGQPVIAPSGGACSNMLGLGYNLPAGSLGGVCTNSPSNVPNCINPIRYASNSLPNMPLYTPTCFENGSSISHLEDGCYPIGSAYGNDLHFVMSNGSPSGLSKRYIREEERKILCDLKYPVNSVYASSAFSANVTYTYPCNSTQIWGINDGITNLNTYLYVTTGTNPLSIPISAIISNDSPNTTTLSCVQSVYGNGTASISGGNIIFTPVVGASGVGLIRYIPKDAANNEGNITYIYVYVQNPTCNVSNTCDFVNNGGFESNFKCGTFFNSTVPANVNGPAYADCWDSFAFSYDIFVRGCNPSNVGPLNQANLGVSTYQMGPPLNSWTGASPNDAVMGLFCGKKTSLTSNYFLSEGASSKLANSLIPGSTYVLNFKLYNYKGGFRNIDGVGVLNMNNASRPLVFSIGTTANQPVSATMYPAPASVASGVLQIINSFTTSSATNTWVNYNYVFTYSPTVNQNGNYLTIGIDLMKTNQLLLNPPYSFGGDYNFYVGIDDVSLQEMSTVPSFSIPQICNASTSYSNLAQYVSPANGTYSFSGTGVTQSAGQYNFNTALTLTPGVYTVNLHYTTPNNCTGILTNTVIVSNPNSFVVTPVNCASGVYTLQSTGLPSITNYTWLPNATFGSSLTVTPSTSSVYTIIATYGTCTYTNAIPITIIPKPIINPVPDVCIGTISPFILNSFVPSMTVTGGQFSGTGVLMQSCPPPNGNCFNINLLPPNTYTPGVYNYTFSILPNPINGIYCSVSNTFNVNFVNPPTPSISALPAGLCILVGQSATLTSGVAPSAGITYSWMPSNATTSSIVVSPTTTTNYTLTVNNTGCSRTNTYTINPIIPFTFVNPPNQICTYQSLYNLEQYLAIGTPTGGTWSSPSGLGVFYSLGAGVTHLNVNPNLTSIGTHTITYSYVSPSNPTCNITNSFTITVHQGFSLSSSMPMTYCRNLAGSMAVISATGSPVPPLGITYIWQPNTLIGSTHTVTPLSSTIYSLTATSGACVFTTAIAIDTRTDCCAAPNYIVGNTLSSATLTAGSYALNQNVVISGTVELINSEVRIASNVKITVPNGAMLKLFNSHLYTCSDVNMWQGTDVINGGRFHARESLIEDAFTAVNSLGATGTSTIAGDADVYLEQNVFNRNLIAVGLKNYQLPVPFAPFYIAGNVFTCRSLPFTATTWPNAHTFGNGLRVASVPSTPLSSPYDLQNYLPNNLKPPMNFLSASIGVYAENVGSGLNLGGITPVFNSVAIGNSNASDFEPLFNLFDNLYHGIYAKNANLESYCSVFQNIKRGVSGSATYGGIGIFATADSLQATNNRVSIVNPLYALSTTSLVNKFYDCHTAIFLNNILNANLQFAQIHSSQLLSLPVTNTLLTSGVCGIRINGNRFNGYEVSQNKIYNHQTGISLGTHYGLLSISGLPGYGRFLKTIKIQGNTIMPQLSTATPLGGARIGLAIYAASASNSSGAEITNSNQVLRIENNTINRAYRGVELMNWKYGGFYVAANVNTITLVQDINPSPQYGISMKDCNRAKITRNGITGFSQTYSLCTGIYSSVSQTCTIDCNNLNTTFVGFEFAGSNAGSLWKNNAMQNHQRGLYLSQNGVIGQQGSFNSPSDNQWIGANWTGLNYQTYTQAGSFAINSKLAIRTLFGFDPINNANSGAQFIQTYNAVGAKILANNNAPILNCTPNTGGGGGGGCPTCRTAFMDLLNDIASNNLTYSVNVQETEEINKNIVYEEILKDPSLALESSTLNAFFISNQSETRGAYNAIEQDLGNGNITSANSRINGFSPSTNIEYNYKQYYELEAKFARQEALTTDEMTTLRLLCFQCPFIDGTIVYKARTLFNLLSQSEVQYHDGDCIKDGYSYSRGTGTQGRDELEEQLKQREKNLSDKFKDRLVYHLFPNPAQDKVTVVSSANNQKLIVKITDVNGKLIQANYYYTENYQFNVQLDLLNGIYFVTLEDQSGQKTVKKLIIVK